MENEIKILKKKERKRQNKNRGKEKVVRVGKRVKKLWQYMQNKANIYDTCNQ